MVDPDDEHDAVGLDVSGTGHFLEQRFDLQADALDFIGDGW